jgi:PAS domain S-box-containing protein/putative nucleotidyltransferase with HDIG domain
MEKKCTEKYNNREKLLAGKLREAEGKLCISESKYKTLLENIPQKIFYKNAKSVYVAVNPSYAKDFGLQPEDFPGKTDFELFPRDMAEKYRRDDNKVLKSGKIKSVDESYLSGKKKFTVHTVKVPLKNKKGEPTGVLGIFWDITDRVKNLQKLKASITKLQSTIEGAIVTMAHVVEIKDPYTAGHQNRVAQLAYEIAKEMHLPRKKLEAIRMATSIHDIGKIFIPMDILTKPSKLNEIEFNFIKTHPAEAYKILKDIEFPYPIGKIVYQHHERVNGSGYPQGLKKDKICMEARILTVADVVEAMSSHRPYRPAFKIEEALKEIEKNAGILYDKDVVNTCLKIFHNKHFAFH